MKTIRLLPAILMPLLAVGCATQGSAPEARAYSGHATEPGWFWQNLNSPYAQYQQHRMRQDISNFAAQGRAWGLY